mgnify:CR=1 FL=1
MPVKIRKVDGYQVRTPGGVKAKHTTKAKAEAQARLLRGIEHGMVPRKAKTKAKSQGKLKSKKKPVKPSKK